MTRSPLHIDPAGKHISGGPEGFLNWRRKLLRAEAGSTIVEVGISASIVFVLLFAVIQFGYALYTYQFVNEITRELTRYAVVRGTKCGGGMPNCGFTDSSTTLQTYAQTKFNYPGIRLNNLAVTVTWYAPSSYSAENPTWSVCNLTCSVTEGGVPTAVNENDPGNMVKVSVKYPYTLTIPFWTPTLLWVSSSSSMIISQ